MENHCRVATVGDITHNSTNANAKTSILTMTAGCKEYIGSSQFNKLSSLVVLQLFRSQRRQSVVKMGGGQTRRGSGRRESPVGSRGRADLGAKPQEANRYYRIKFEF